MAKRKGPVRTGRAPDPDDNWNDPEPTIDEAAAIADRIAQKSQALDRGTWDRAYDFLSDVTTKAKELAESIARTRTITPGQLKALRGWEAGIDKVAGNTKEQ